MISIISRQEMLQPTTYPKSKIYASSKIRNVKYITEIYRGVEKEYVTCGRDRPVIRLQECISLCTSSPKLKSK